MIDHYTNQVRLQYRRHRTYIFYWQTTGEEKTKAEEITKAKEITKGETSAQVQSVGIGPRDNRISCLRAIEYSINCATWDKAKSRI